MPYVITEACVDVMDRTCVGECPVDCIHEGARMLYIDPASCIDCGACEPACPQSAIYLDELLPAELQPYRTVNAEFYTAPDLGPEAAADHPLVASLPAS